MIPCKQISAVMLAAGLTSCAVGQNYHRPETPVPASYMHGGEWRTAAPADAIDRGDWWALFGDETLNDLESRIDRSNQDVAAAAAA